MSLTRFATSFTFLLHILLASLLHTAVVNAESCNLPTNLADEIGTESAPGSCCQEHICNIPCPIPVDKPQLGFGIAALCAIIISVIIGVGTYFIVRDKAVKFFVAGRSLPLFVIAITLASQSIDGNALLGNVDLSYRYHFWDGAVIPLGLSLSLVLNAIFFAAPINRERLLTLPDLYAKRYGVTVEMLVSIATSVSFLFLLAGNLFFMGIILSYLLNLSQEAGIWLSAGVIWLYTMCGGLVSVAYTDVLQGAVGWVGCLVCTFWFIHNADPAAPPPSRGTTGYIYPSAEICDLYSGVECLFNSSNCCYNPDSPADNAAYPFGDQRVFSDQMTSHLSLSPFPNAIFWNWATVIILAFGNLGALDFQARCMASRTPSSAAIGCGIAAVLTIVVGIPLSYLGAIARPNISSHTPRNYLQNNLISVFYGPDSIHAKFEPNTCSTLLGLATCAEWLPDDAAFLKLLTHEAPKILGAWCLIGLIAATMSTSDGAILALGTVLSHNIFRQVGRLIQRPLSDSHLLLLARLSTLPYAIISAVLAAYGPNTTNLLVVAFDVVLATIIPSLFGAFYTHKPSPTAAFLSFITGTALRLTLQFTLPKDGSFLLPYKDPEFLKYGSAASLKAPTFFDGNPNTIWNPDIEPCVQSRYRDYTGVDSLVALLASALVFVTVQAIESWLGRRLFWFPGDEGYVKDTCDCIEDESEKNGKLDSEL